jgi:hypothetical protein
MAFEKIEIQKAELVTESVIDYQDFFNKCKIDLNKKYDRPPLAISLGYSQYGREMYPNRFVTFGNISMIIGDKKSRKTFFKSMLLACAIGGQSSDFNNQIKGHNLQDKLIIDIDTEQDLYDNWQTAKRIPAMVGSVPENYISINLRGCNPTEIQGFLDWLFLESPYKDKLGIVAIDGYVDCINDFNNQTESKEFVTKLMKYSKTANCHITGVLHLNPGSEKSRGHFGTILEQKVEMVAMVKSIEGANYSEVTCKAVRGAKGFDGFCISVNNDGLPYTTEDRVDINWAKK